jgi:hypothetical protein
MYVLYIVRRDIVKCIIFVTLVYSIIFNSLEGHFENLDGCDVLKSTYRNRKAPGAHN